MDTNGLSNAALAIAMLGSILLFGGGIAMIWKQHDKKRGILMIVAALVTLMNVLIWAWPR